MSQTRSNCHYGTESSPKHTEMVSKYDHHTWRLAVQGRAVTAFIFFLGETKMGRHNFNMYSKLMDVTPEIAKRWLEQNRGNRSINQKQVDTIAKDILAGDFDTTHQGIAIATDGTLLDGQHRLLAIVKANKTVKLMVTFNAVKSRHIDSGMKRSESNRLQMGADDMSWVNSRILAAINLLKAVYPKLGLEQTINKEAWIRKYETVIRSGAALARHSQIQRLNNAGIMASFIVAMMNGVPESYIKTFSEALTSGYPNSPAENYAITLRNDLLSYKGAVAGDSWRKFAYERSCNRINQFYLAATGQNVAKRIKPDYNPYDIMDASEQIVYRKGKFVGA